MSNDGQIGSSGRAKEPLLRSESRRSLPGMRRLAALLIGLLMLVHAMVPALPSYVCTDGGRSLNPCSPVEERATAPAVPEWNLGDCCKLTAPAIVDAQPPSLTNPAQRFSTVSTLIPAAPVALAVMPGLLLSPPLARGDPALRGPPLRRHPILRI